MADERFLWQVQGNDGIHLFSREFEKAFTAANKYLVLNLDDMKKAVMTHNLTESLVGQGIASPAELVKAGKRFSDIAVVSSDLAAYGPLVRRAFLQNRKKAASKLRVHRTANI